MPSGCYNCTTLPLRFTEVEYENSKDLSKQLKLVSELLNEEFQCYKRVARSLMKTLIRQKDLKICDILIKRCSKLNGSENLKVKKEVNGFFKYFLKILCWTSDNQPIETYENWKNPHHAVCKYKANAWLNKHWATKLKQDGPVSIRTDIDINKYNWQNKDLAA